DALPSSPSHRTWPCGSSSAGARVTVSRTSRATSAAFASGTPASVSARSASRAERSSFSERSGRYTASWNQAARRTTSGSPAYSASSSTRSRTAVRWATVWYRRCGSRQRASRLSAYGPASGPPPGPRAPSSARVKRSRRSRRVSSASSVAAMGPLFRVRAGVSPRRSENDGPGDLPLGRVTGRCANVRPRAGPVSPEESSCRVQPTYVLVHGAFANPFSFAPLQADLGLLGHRSVAVDLPGHGFGATYTRAYQAPQDPEVLAAAPGAIKGVTLADNAAHLIGILERAKRNGPVILVAHSRGGITATAAANARPDLIDRIVYVAA